ncbi:MAG: OmpH family outer membrane protein [Bacteroidales bacterium]|nr:OmpH family outer membrane protein [Bacteroidales bacterium]
MNKSLPTILSVAALVIAIAAGIFTFIGKPGVNNTSNTTQHILQAGDSSFVIPVIAYFNVDEVLDSYDRANELNDAFTTKANNFRDQFTREQNAINNQYNKLQEEYNKGLVLPSVAEQKMQEIQKKSENFSNNFSKKQQELDQELAVLTNQINNDIHEYVVKFNEEHHYTYIFANQSGLLPLPVVAADTTFNITAQIIEGLNKQYAADKEKPADAE